MAASPVSGGLMQHQKDEHDIWICKSCGWKYPNAKPSAKIRKHHKRQCPGTGGPDPHHDEEISDHEASDDEHHHVPTPGLPHAPDSEPPLGEHPGPLADHRGDHQIAASSPREFQIDEPISLQSNGAGEENRDVASRDLARQEPEEPRPKVDDSAHSATTSAARSASLMEHQKDEHDIWICKDCGWKYPNAKPSPKVKRHHRKQCPGHKEAEVRPTGGGSSDEHEHAGDDDLPRQSPHVDEAAAENLTQSRNSRDSVTLKDDVASSESGAAGGIAKESDQNVAESLTDHGGDHHISASSAREFQIEEPKSLEGNGAGQGNLSVASRDVAKQEPEGLGPKVDSAKGASTDGGHSVTLMEHQKDEHDIWICKDCGWKYPNAKPSPKVKRHHRKQCPGHKEAEVRPTRGGSSDEQEHSGDDELPGQSPHVEEVPLENSTQSKREATFEGNVLSGKSGAADGVATVSDKSVAESVKDHGADHHISAFSAREFQIEKPKSLEGNETRQGNPSVASRDLAKQEGPGPKVDDSARGASTSAGHSATLMEHQKDEHDIWICKDCGWKYPNARPSPKVKRHHRKQCPGRKEAEARPTGGGSSDEHEHSGDDDVAHT